MKILVVGSGGREAALVWKLAQSAGGNTIFAAPGNPGMAKLATLVPLKPMQMLELADFAEEKGIDLTIVGPEDPLAHGIVDLFVQRGLKIFGPTQAAARLESSKGFAVKVMHTLGIPCPITIERGSFELAMQTVTGSAFPLVLKADGLCAGKGVVVCHTKAEAETWLREVMLEKKFVSAGDTVLVQEFLQGSELSFHAFCDGKKALLFPASKDHKRLHDGDKGPNTGGMGAIAPVWVSVDMEKYVLEKIIQPILSYLAEQGTPYIGCLYVGVMVTNEGIKVLEFNVRFGDPETQVYMPLLASDLSIICKACVEGTLDQIQVRWHDLSAVCVVLASDGYPGKYGTGYPIYGLEEDGQPEGVMVFHAGTRLDAGIAVTNGGRVLSVAALGLTTDDAYEAAYAAVHKIKFHGMYYRTDIGAV